MAELTERICLIAGGTGTVGEGIVRAFLRAGATVVVPSRSEERLAALAERLEPGLLGGLVSLAGDIGDPDDAARLRDAVFARFGRIDAVVASLGGTFEARQPVTALSLETWDQYHRDNLRSHFVAARTLLPSLAERPGSSYTLLGGLSALLPIPLYSPVAVNSAAQLMMAETLMLEMKKARVRINQVICGYVNTRARAAYAKPEWITADEVGEFCAYIASSAGSMVSGAVLRLGDRPPPE
jgi:NAD(P)-dependent dehydrogenase (short-subunit alcohol dehydrogenase family)